MICKKCGAYNPDHANFCKVCAANLKDQTDTDDSAKTVDAEETVEKELRPRRGNVKAPDFSAARRAGVYTPAPKAEAPAAKKDEEEDIEEEEVKPTAKQSSFARPAAPVQKRRIVDEDEDDEDEYDEDEDEYEEEKEEKPAKRKSLFSRVAAPVKKRPAVDDDDEDDDYDDEEDEDDDDGDAEKLESEPKTSRFARPSPRKRPVKDDDEDEDDEEEENDDGYDDDDDDDGYEEYEPTPPRRKKTGRSQSKGGEGGFNIVAVLIVCLLAILLIIVGIVVFCNLKSDMQSKLPSFLQFNCVGKATTEKDEDKDTRPQKQKDDTASPDVQTDEPNDAPVTGDTVDYSATKLERKVDDSGTPYINISMIARPGDKVTIVLPNQDDYVEVNDDDTDRVYAMKIYESCYYPNTPLTESIYTVTPQILVTHADGTEEYLEVESFDIVFPTVQLELKEPARELITEDGIMVAEDNTLFISGQVDDHTVTVTVNGQPVKNMYKEGNFDYTFVLTGDQPETVTIEATKADYVPTSISFTVKPYVFIPDPMKLTVESDLTKLRADKNQKVTVTGTTVPGATLTAYAAPEYQTSVVCGAPVVDAEGHFSFEVTFDKNYYGIATIILHAKKDGYEEGETTCIVSRMYADQKSAITGFSKTKSYHEVYRYYKFEDVMANPTANGLYRFSGKVVAVDPETGVVTVEIESAAKTKATIYVLNASSKWDPDKHVGDRYFLYCTLNGLYTDGTSLYATAWFIKKIK